MLPQEIFEKLALTKAILVHFGQYNIEFLANYVNIIISKPTVICSEL
jgi:hypothetical protein